MLRYINGEKRDWRTLFAVLLDFLAIESLAAIYEVILQGVVSVWKTE